MSINVTSLTEVQIANFAIARIAGGRIEAFDPPEDSTESHQVNLWFHHCRRLTLELFDWPFARKRLAVAEDSNDPPDGVWAYRYQYPADAISVRYIENPAGRAADPVPMKIELPQSSEVKTILCDVADAVVVYTANITSPALMPSSFADAFSLVLADKLSSVISGDARLKEEVRKEVERMMARATALASNSEKQHKPRDASWIEDR